MFIKSSTDSGVILIIFYRDVFYNYLPKKILSIVAIGYIIFSIIQLINGQTEVKGPSGNWAEGKKLMLEQHNKYRKTYIYI